MSVSALRVQVPRRRIAPRGSVLLDFLRAGAAALVMLGHVRGLYFVNYASVEESGPIMAVFYFATGLGHQAVMIFFVLSGYFIASNALAVMGDGRWTWRWYLARRVTRLTVVLWPALAIGAAIDAGGLTLFGLDGPYGAAPEYRHIVLVPVPERTDAIAWIGNALFLQEILVPSYGSNGPLWSLSYEFWYYLLFPALVLALFGRSAPRIRAFWALAALAIALLVGERILLYFTIWLMGAAVQLVPLPYQWAQRGWRRAVVLGAAISAWLGAMVAAKAALLPAFAGDAAVGAATALIVYLLQTAPGVPRAATARLAKTLAGFSYTLYLAHLPPLVFGAAAILAAGGERWQPGLKQLAFGTAIALATLGYAFALSRITEARTDTVRRRLLVGA
ncbi:MAG: acyltransferase family protein [Alphaproteobacteria bacterium]